MPGTLLQEDDDYIAPESGLAGEVSADLIYLEVAEEFFSDPPVSTALAMNRIADATVPAWLTGGCCLPDHQCDDGGHRRGEHGGLNVQFQGFDHGAT